MVSEPVLVGDVFPGLGSSAPDLVTGLGAGVVFAADDGVAVMELWRLTP